MKTIVAPFRERGPVLRALAEPETAGCVTRQQVRMIASPAGAAEVADETGRAWVTSRADTGRDTKGMTYGAGRPLARWEVRAYEMHLAAGASTHLGDRRDAGRSIQE